MSLPDVSSPSVVLLQANPQQQQSSWRANQTTWAPSLTLQQHIERETYFLDAPLNRNGGLTPWILSDTSLAEEDRPLLSSLETIRKPAIYRDPKDGLVKDVTSYGVASVFTLKEYRGRGYASKLVELMGSELASRQAASPGAAQFSFLYSDIGPKFYAKNGWIARGNTQLGFKTNADTEFIANPNVKDVTDDMLPELTARDEQLLRAVVAQPSSKVRAAVLPTMDVFNWQYYREDYIFSHIHGRKPTVRGAIYTSPTNPEARVWALWKRTRYDGDNDDGVHVCFDVLDFLHLVVDDDNGALPDDELADALKGVFAVANREAKDWGCKSYDTWNPSDRIRRVIEEKLPELGAEFVQRDIHELASIKWFGDEADDDVEWVANEKYCWC